MNIISTYVISRLVLTPQCDWLREFLGVPILLFTFVNAAHKTPIIKLQANLSDLLFVVIQLCATDTDTWRLYEEKLAYIFLFMFLF